jgi:hypothetical protein
MYIYVYEDTFYIFIYIILYIYYDLFCDPIMHNLQETSRI